jgi:surface antigen
VMAPARRAVPWSSADPAGQVTASGWVVPTSDDYRRGGKLCRNLDQHVLKDGGSQDRQITLCRRVALGNASNWVVPQD